MLGRDVLILKQFCFFGRLVDHALEARRDEDLRHLLRVEPGADAARRPLQVLGQAFFHQIHRRAHALEHLGDQALRLLQQSQEQVLDVDLAVAIALHDLVSAHGCVLGPLCEPIKSHHEKEPPSSRRGPGSLFFPFALDAERVTLPP